MLSHRNKIKTPPSVETISQPGRTSLFDRQEILAPTGFVSVYHTTPGENLASVELVGLQPSFAQKRRVNDFIDKLRPAGVKALGVSRDSVYAEPFKSQHYIKGIQLELAVDPVRCFVADSRYASNVMVYFNNLGRKAKNSAEARELAEAYWGSLITLSDFLEHYENSDGSASATLKDGSAAELQPLYSLPEVLIPYSVTPEHIRAVDGHTDGVQHPILSAIHSIASQRTEG